MLSGFLATMSMTPLCHDDGESFIARAHFLGLVTEKPQEHHVYVSDETILEKAFHAKNGTTFSQ
jgi:hypothetical protein